MQDKSPKLCLWMICFFVWCYWITFNWWCHWCNTFFRFSDVIGVEQVWWLSINLQSNKVIVLGQISHLAIHDCHIAIAYLAIKERQIAIAYLAIKERQIASNYLATKECKMVSNHLAMLVTSCWRHQAKQGNTCYVQLLNTYWRVKPWQ